MNPVCSRNMLHTIVTVQRETELCQIMGPLCSRNMLHTSVTVERETELCHIMNPVYSRNMLHTSVTVKRERQNFFRSWVLYVAGTCSTRQWYKSGVHCKMR